MSAKPIVSNSLAALEHHQEVLLQIVTFFRKVISVMIYTGIIMTIFIHKLELSVMVFTLLAINDFYIDMLMQGLNLIYIRYDINRQGHIKMMSRLLPRTDKYDLMASVNQKDVEWLIKSVKSNEDIRWLYRVPFNDDIIAKRVYISRSGRSITYVSDLKRNFGFIDIHGENYHYLSIWRDGILTLNDFNSEKDVVDRLSNDYSMPIVAKEV